MRSFHLLVAMFCLAVALIGLACQSTSAQSDAQRKLQDAWSNYAHVAADPSSTPAQVSNAAQLVADGIAQLLKANADAASSSITEKITYALGGGSLGAGLLALVGKLFGKSSNGNANATLPTSAS